MPKICFIPSGKNDAQNVCEVVHSVCDLLGFDIASVPAEKSEPASQQIQIENSAFVIADVTMDPENIASFSQVSYNIGYARRAQKIVFLLSHKESISKPNLGEDDILYYDPNNIEKFRSQLIVQIVSLCNKEKFRYTRFPGMPVVGDQEKLPILGKQDLRVENYVSIGDSYVDCGKYEQAHQEYSRAILFIGQGNLQPHHCHIFFKRGFVCRKLGMMEDTLADYAQSIGLNPQYVDAYVARGLALYDAKKYQEALADFLEAGKLKPDFTRAYVLSGAMARLVGKYEDAITQLNKAIELNPEYPDAFFTRGQVYVDTKNFDLAIADFSKAIELKAAYTDAFIKRGLVHHTIKNFDLAIADFSKAVELDPHNVDAYNYRGQSLYEKGYHEFHELAIKDWEKAISLGSPVSNDLEQKIKITQKTI